MRWRQSRPLLLLAAVVTLLFCAVHERWTPVQWAVPVNYDGDSLEVLARLQAAAEGDLVPLTRQCVTRLGAPFGADWSEYPGSDAWANFALGQLARLTGLGAASNLALWLAHLSAALTFYGCARLLRHRREWALAGALLFAFSYFSFSRGLPHLWLVFTWQAPLALVTCWLIAAGGRALQRPGLRWLCLGTAVALGASNPYSLFLYLQLLAWSLVATWRRREAAANRRLGFACLAAALGMFALSHLPVWLHAHDEGGRPLLTRNYAGTEIYGLKPIELVLPPADHRSNRLAALGSRYVRWSDWRGETFSPYLGLIGAFGLGWLLLDLALRLAHRRGPRPGAQGLQALWILLFSSIGGVNSILAFYFGLQVFRATNRYSIFLFALALFFLVARLSSQTRTWRPAARRALALGVVGLGLWDQIPRGPTAEAKAIIAAQVAADRALAAKLELATKPGAMVFQLPVVDFPEGDPRLHVRQSQFARHRNERTDFPEGDPRLHVRPYDHFRPYLATETLRFSFGTPKGRAGGSWQRDFERKAPADLVPALEQAGFAAVLINRAGYPDRAEQLLAGFTAAGRPAQADRPEAYRAVVLLEPVAKPLPPLARNPTFGRGWHPRARSEIGRLPMPPPFFNGKSDWPPPNGSVDRQRFSPGAESEGRKRTENIRWANGPAVLMYHNPLPTPLAVRLELWLSAPDERGLELRHNGGKLAAITLDDKPRLLEVELTLRPGMHRLDFLTDRPAVRVSERRWSLRAFAVHELAWTIDSQPPVQLADEEP